MQLQNKPLCFPPTTTWPPISLSFVENWATKAHKRHLPISNLRYLYPTNYLCHFLPHSDEIPKNKSMSSYLTRNIFKLKLCRNVEESPLCSSTMS